MRAKFEAEHPNQEPIVAVVNDVARLLNERGVTSGNTLIATYKFPCPFITPPPGRISQALETGYAIVDSRDVTSGEFGAVSHLAIVEPMHGELNQGQFRHDGFVVWVNPHRINPEITTRIRTGLVINHSS